MNIYEAIDLALETQASYYNTKITWNSTTYNAIGYSRIQDGVDFSTGGAQRNYYVIVSIPLKFFKTKNDKGEYVLGTTPQPKDILTIDGKDYIVEQVFNNNNGFIIKIIAQTNKML